MIHNGFINTTLLQRFNLSALFAGQGIFVIHQLLLFLAVFMLSPLKCGSGLKAKRNIPNAFGTFLLNGKNLPTGQAGNAFASHRAFVLLFVLQLRGERHDA